MRDNLTTLFDQVAQLAVALALPLARLLFTADVSREGRYHGGSWPRIPQLGFVKTRLLVERGFENCTEGKALVGASCLLDREIFITLEDDPPPIGIRPTGLV